MSIKCPHCSASFDSLAEPGSIIVCPYCATSFQLPNEATAADVPSASDTSPAPDSSSSSDVPESPDMPGITLIAGSIAQDNEEVGDEMVAQPPDPWTEVFNRVEETIDALPNDLHTDKARLKEAVRKIRLHAHKGAAGEADELQHELVYLIQNAPSIFEATQAALYDPRLGVAGSMRLAIHHAQEAANPTPAPPAPQSAPMPRPAPPVYEPPSFTPPPAFVPPPVYTPPPAPPSNNNQWVLWGVGIGVVACCILPVLTFFGCALITVLITAAQR